MSLELRPATVDDAQLLLAWRNDPQTRANSFNSAKVSMAQHMAWLSSVLANPARRLLVAVLRGEAVGTVRIDTDDDGAELSWTVAPEARGAGVGKAMVRQAVASLSGPVRAEVKTGNAASVRVAQAAGLVLASESNGALTFRRP